MSDERLSPERLAEIETSACNANDREHPHRGGEQVAVIALGVWELLSEVKAAWAETERLIAEVARLERELEAGDQFYRTTVTQRAASLDELARVRAERDSARAWSARWKEAARSYRRSARQNGESWQRACDDISVLSADLARIRLNHARIEAEADNARLQALLAERDAEVARLVGDAFTANELAIMYRLIDRYTEDAYSELPKDHPSHVVRETLRDRVTRHLIAARAALAARGGEVRG